MSEPTITDDQLAAIRDLLALSYPEIAAKSSAVSLLLVTARNLLAEVDRHHQQHPLSEDVRKKVVHAMDGHGAVQFPGHVGSRWRDTDGDVWIHSDDGRMRQSHHPTDPEILAKNLGPMTRVGGE